MEHQCPAINHWSAGSTARMGDVEKPAGRLPVGGASAVTAREQEVTNRGMLDVGRDY